MIDLIKFIVNPFYASRKDLTKKDHGIKFKLNRKIKLLEIELKSISQTHTINVVVSIKYIFKTKLSLFHYVTFKCCLHQIPIIN